MNRQQQIDSFLFAAHELAGERLQQEPTRVVQAANLLSNWRAKSGKTATDPLWDEWQVLLAKPTEQLIAAMTMRSDHADHLRSVSPMSALITQAERTVLLQRSRQAA